jgi:hypothetical protein
MFKHGLSRDRSLGTSVLVFFAEPCRKNFGFSFFKGRSALSTLTLLGGTFLVGFVEE